MQGQLGYGKGVSQKVFKKCVLGQSHSLGWQDGSVGKGTAVKPDSMSSIPGIHVAGGENQLPQAAH